MSGSERHTVPLASRSKALLQEHAGKGSGGQLWSGTSWSLWDSVTPCGSLCFRKYLVKGEVGVPGFCPSSLCIPSSGQHTCIPPPPPSCLNQKLGIAPLLTLGQMMVVSHMFRFSRQLAPG